jgi:hypothetical protein
VTNFLTTKTRRHEEIGWRNNEVRVFSMVEAYQHDPASSISAAWSELLGATGLYFATPLRGARIF